MLNAEKSSSEEAKNGAFKLQNKYPMGSVSLSWLQNVYSWPLFRQAILTGKVGQTDLVFGVR